MTRTERATATRLRRVRGVRRSAGNGRGGGCQRGLRQLLGYREFVGTEAELRAWTTGEGLKDVFRRLGWYGVNGKASLLPRHSDARKPPLIFDLTVPDAALPGGFTWRPARQAIRAYDHQQHSPIRLHVTVKDPAKNPAVARPSASPSASTP